MITTVIFDFDGVLSKSETRHFDVFNHILSKYGKQIDMDFYQKVCGSTIIKSSNMIIEHTGVDMTAEAMAQSFLETDLEFIKNYGAEPIEGAIELVKRLHGKYKLAVCSGSAQNVIEDLVEHFGLSGYFEKLVSCSRVKNPKPAPDGYLYTAELLGVNPENCAVIEDSFNGVAAAKSAGMYTIGFYSPDSIGQDVSAADITVKHLSEINL